MRDVKLPTLRLTPWQRRLLVGFVTVLSSQFYLSVWAEGYRVSAAAVLYPVGLVTLMRDSHRPDTGAVTGLCVLAFRTAAGLLLGLPLLTALRLEYPGGVFYLCYDCLLCLLVRDRRAASPLGLWLSLFACDALSNTLNLTLSGLALPDRHGLLTLAALALGRSLAACTLLWAGRRYQRLLLGEEHERRYRQLFLMTANLKSELYFLKKDAEDIEAVMSNAYRLYERLEESDQELSALALAIARDVHEVKKDNLRIIRGIEAEVAQTHDGASMALSDLLHILETSTRQLLGQDRLDIRLECRWTDDLPIREHYRLLSILKNLVTNAVEAIQAGTGRGTVQVDCRVQGDELLLLVEDNGPGIPPKALKLLFQVGYSTKFNPQTGDINRGVGLPAVAYIVEELGGTIQVCSEESRSACFTISLPLAAVTGGAHENLHH